YVRRPLFASFNQSRRKTAAAALQQHRAEGHQHLGGGIGREYCSMRITVDDVVAATAGISSKLVMMKNDDVMHKDDLDDHCINDDDNNNTVSTVKRDYCKDPRASLTTIGGKKRKSVDGKDGISSIRHHHHHYRGEVDEPPAATSTTAAKRTRIDLRQWLGIVSDSAAATAGVAGAVVGSCSNDDGNTPRDRVAGENYDDTRVIGNDEVCSSYFEFDFNEGHTNAVKKTVYVRDFILPPHHNSAIKMHE
ncbi:hypothetical protein FOZ62_010624, partial [Perkinsus olseni]